MKKVILILAILLLTACTPSEASFKSNVPTLEDRIAQVETTEMLTEINLDIPFFSQAPDGDWGMPWQEACEEASVTLAYYYAADKKLTKQAFIDHIWDLVAWQKGEYGQYEHTDITQTYDMLLANFNMEGINAEVVENITVEKLKELLTQGKAIVAPFAGRQLGNPFYSEEGPYYHMMVIKGYDETHFITNDVGTRRGENFIYPYETIISALHEWHDSDINLGEAKVIAIY